MPDYPPCMRAMTLLSLRNLSSLSTPPLCAVNHVAVQRLDLGLGDLFDAFLGQAFWDSRGIRCRVKGLTSSTPKYECGAEGRWFDGEKHLEGIRKRRDAATPATIL